MASQWYSGKCDSGRRVMPDQYPLMALCVKKADTCAEKRWHWMLYTVSADDQNLVVRTTSRRPGCCSCSSLTPTTPTEVFSSPTFEFWLPRCPRSDVCCPTVVVFFEKQQLDAFVSANGVGGESFCCCPPPPPPPSPWASFELVSAGTFANSGETPFCKLGYSNSRRLFRPPGPPAARRRWGGGRLRGQGGGEGRARPRIPLPES